MNENQENGNEVIENQRSVNHRRKKKTFWILGVVAVVIIAFGIFIGINLQKVNSFTKNISAQDSKLLDRETNASSMTSKLSYNDFITETNMIIDSRNKLIKDVENQKVLLFNNNKIYDLKGKLTSENENVKTEQLNRLKKELSDIEKKDNIAIGDFISMGMKFVATGNSLYMKLVENNLMYEELFDKLNENANDRDKTIDYIKNMEMLSYTSKISGYIDLLQAENKLVRSYFGLLNNLFNQHHSCDDPRFGNYYDCLDAKKQIVIDFAGFKTDYEALLDKDKTFWLNVKDLLLSRDLQQALTDFYNKVHDTCKPFLT